MLKSSFLCPFLELSLATRRKKTNKNEALFLKKLGDVWNPKPEKKWRGSLKDWTRSTRGRGQKTFIAVDLRKRKKKKKVANNIFQDEKYTHGFQSQNVLFELMERHTQAGGRSCTRSSLILRYRGWGVNEDLHKYCVKGTVWSVVAGSRGAKPLQLPVPFGYGERDAKEHLPTPHMHIYTIVLPEKESSLLFLNMALAILPDESSSSNWSRKNYLRKWMIKEWTSLGSSQT